MLSGSRPHPLYRGYGAKLPSSFNRILSMPRSTRPAHLWQVGTVRRAAALTPQPGTTPQGLSSGRCPAGTPADPAEWRRPIGPAALAVTVGTGFNLGDQPRKVTLRHSAGGIQAMHPQVHMGAAAACHPSPRLTLLMPALTPPIRSRPYGRRFVYGAFRYLGPTGPTLPSVYSLAPLHLWVSPGPRLFQTPLGPR